MAYYTLDRIAVAYTELCASTRRKNSCFTDLLLFRIDTVKSPAIINGYEPNPRSSAYFQWI